MQPPNDPNAPPWAGSIAGGALNGDGIAGKNISMPLLAMRLSRSLLHPVLDKTALTGSFDFKYQFPDYDPHQDAQAFISSTHVAPGYLPSYLDKFDQGTSRDHRHRPIRKANSKLSGCPRSRL